MIAINNVGNFEEIQTRTKEVTEALEYQTATSEVLGVISKSPSDLQPVLDAVVTAGCRLLGGQTSVLQLLKGDALHFGAMFNASGKSEDADPRLRLPLTAATMGMWSDVIVNRVPAIVADTETDERITPDNREIARTRGYRSFVSVPLLRRDEVIGTLNVSRRETGPFARKEIALLQTFADQAVIAISNVGNFEEIQTRTKEVTEAWNIRRRRPRCSASSRAPPNELAAGARCDRGDRRRACAKPSSGTSDSYDGELMRLPPCRHQYHRRGPRSSSAPGTAVPPIRTGMSKVGPFSKADRARRRHASADSDYAPHKATCGWTSGARCWACR